LVFRLAGSAEIQYAGGCGGTLDYAAFGNNGPTIGNGDDTAIEAT
jgi:hypothetical protein